ncbi:vomeronasal type-1 receptor 3-like [Ctenodactylus gundi]
MKDTFQEYGVKMIFLSEAVAGFLGNFLLVYNYDFLNFSRGTGRATDLILKHLSIANVLVLLSKGVPQTMTAFEWTHSLSDIGCKCVIYAHRVGKGMCMGSTCLLSVSQATIISPQSSRWAKLKVVASKRIGLSTILLWILNMLINIMTPIYVTSKRNNTINLGFCSSVVGNNKIIESFVLTLMSSYEVLCVGLMLGSSGSMVLILHRHKKQVQHIHSTKLSRKSSPESRATQSILLLVSTFVSFYFLSYCVSLLLVLFRDPSGWLVNTYALTTVGFAVVSPFVIMSRDPRIPQLNSACCEVNTWF